MPARICISSTGGGGGKTLLTLGLCGAWRKKGIIVKPFKKGPDYIDAAWLASACGLPCTCLDPFFMSLPKLGKLFADSMAASCAEIAVIEGNRGLYDGLDEYGSCSTAAIARFLKCPVLLCINCSKSTRTIAAILKGLINFEDNLNFCGVILNKTGSTRHETSLRRAIEASLDLPVLGALPRLRKNPLPERHMGLASRGASVNDKAGQILNELAEFVSNNCNVDAIYKAAVNVPALNFAKTVAVKSSNKLVRIGYVDDSALWFYYRENLESLENCGAELVRLSVLEKDISPLWDTVDGLYIGGGFPEDFAREISSSLAIKKLANLAKKNMPVYAECGGMILLLNGLKKQDVFYPMSNIFNLAAYWAEKPQGLGYIEAKVIKKNPYFMQNSIIRGHEFHYSGCCNKGAEKNFALKLTRGSGISNGFDGLVSGNIWASYMHIFAPANPGWAENFVMAAQQWRKGP